MSNDEIMSRATAMRDQASVPEYSAKDLPTSRLAKGAFSRGIESLKGTAVDLIPALGGAIFGQKDYAREQLKEYADRMAAIEELNPTAYKSYKDVQGLGDVIPFAAETLGEIGPDVLSFIGGAGLGVQAGKYAAKRGVAGAVESIAKRGLTDDAAAALEKRIVDSAVRKGAQVGSTTGLFGSSMAMNVPDVFQSIYETTGSLEPGLALTIGPIVGLLDTYLPGKILNQLGPSGKARLAANLLDKSEVVPVNFKRAFVGNILKTTAGEGSTEGLQEALTIAAEQIAGDTKGFFSPQNIDRIITSSLKGAIGGGTLGTPGAAMEASREKALAKAEIDRRAAAGEITPQEQQQQILALGYTPLPAMQQVETDQTKRPIEAAPGVIFDPRTGTYTTQEAEQAPGRAVNPIPTATQGTPELVGLGAPQVNLAPAQAEMFGLTAYEKPAQTIDQALAGPPKKAAQFTPVLSADVLKGTGLKPQSGFYKQLVDKDVSKPKDQKAVAQILAQVRSNPSLSDSTKRAVEGVAMQAFNTLANQREMFTPLGNVKKEADYGRVQPRPVSGTSGEGVQVFEQPGQVPTEGIATPGQRGLAPIGRPVREPGVREEVQPDTLNETIEPTPTVETTPPVTEAPVAETTAAQTFAKAPKNLKVLQDQIAQLTEDYKQTTDPEVKRAIKAEADATQKDINEGRYQTFTEDATQPFTGDVTELTKQLRAALDKMGLHNVGLKLEQEIVRQRNGKVLSHRGEYNPIERVIRLSLKKGPNFLNTLNHEAIHAMRDTGIFSFGDWKVLSGMAKSKWIDQYDIRKRWEDTSASRDEDSIVEEAVAEAFRHFQMQTPKVQSIMEKAINALRKIGNFLNGYGYQTEQEIFGKAASGQLAKDRAEVIARFDAYLDTQVNKEPKYQVAAAKNVFNGIDNVIRSSSVGTDTQKAALSNGIERSTNAIKSSMLGLLPGHALASEADRVFRDKLGAQFGSGIRRRQGFQDGLTNGIDPVMKELKDAIKTRPEQRKPFDKVVNKSTLYEVDPTKPRSEYVGKTDSSGNSKEAAWDELNKEYSKLSPVWKVAYKTMRDAYKKMYDEIVDAINSRIDSTGISEEAKTLLKTDIKERLAKRGMIEPYFALGREGDKWLSFNYKDANGQPQRAHEAFTSTYARDTRKAELLKLGIKDEDVQAYSKLSEIDYRNAPPGSFVNSVLQIMDVNKVPQDVIDETMRLFISTLPETAFAKSFQKRKGDAGYMEDTIGVFERKIRNMAHQVANMKYNPELSNTVTEMAEYANKVGKGSVQKKDAQGNLVIDSKGDPVFEPARDNVTENAYADEYKKRLGYVLNPTKNDIGSIFNSVAFTYLLGFNVSSALVNMVNVPMIVAPYLKGKYADAAVARALGDAAKLFVGSGTKTKMGLLGNTEGRRTEMNVMPSINNYAPDSEMGKRYATAIKLWNENGQLNRSQLYEIINGDTRTGPMAKFNAASGWMFHHGERMNREVTLVAAYNLELDRLMKGKPKSLSEADSKAFDAQAKEQAAYSAIDTVEVTNGSIAAADAPRWAQNSIGKMVFMFKRYGISMYYMMFKTAREALKGATPEERKAAWKQLGGIVGMSGLMAGAQGIPMYGALSMLYAMFCDDDDEDLDTVTRKYLGEFLYKGPIEYATNLAIAGRITLNDLVIRDTKGGSGSGTFAEQVGQIFGPAVGVADRVKRGYSKINEGHFWRGVEDLLPSAASNVFKGARYLTEGTTTLRGDPITGDVSAYNAAAQMFGFAPADYTRQLEINATEKGIDKTLSEKSSKLKQKYYMAKRNGDTDGMADVRDKLLEMGAKHPELGISPATVKGVLDRSMTAQERASKEMLNGVRYNKKRLAEVKASLAEYED
jgi:hypothetical protein